MIILLEPSKPLNLRLVDASAGEATLTWNEPKHKNGHLIQYILKYFSLPDGKVHQQELDINVYEVKVSFVNFMKDYFLTW